MFLIEGFDGESILSVGHLDIVAGAYNSLGISKITDTATPKTRNHNLTGSSLFSVGIQLTKSKSKGGVPPPCMTHPARCDRSQVG